MLWRIRSSEWTATSSIWQARTPISEGEVRRPTPQPSIVLTTSPRLQAQRALDAGGWGRARPTSLSTIEAAAIIGQMNQQLLDSHWDGFRLGLLSLRQTYSEHSILEAGLDLVRGYGRW